MKGFAKLHLQPGETKTARIVLTPRSFAVFDVNNQEWIARSGTFIIRAARNAADFVSIAEVSRDRESRSKP